MPHSAGEKIGAYEIQGLLGTGGMGEVYRARDIKLGRDVAIKVLPVALAGDPQRMARFAREAQVLASLNHPNIAAIYGLEDSAGIRALVMELVEGPTLADLISAAHHPLAPSSGRRGIGDSPPGSGGGPGVVKQPGVERERDDRRSPLPFNEALSIAKQIAEALEAAHERGVAHRDLKPANIKVTHEGTVKILDFGLAKAFEMPDSSSNVANSPTLSVAATEGGMILGTAAYMSPEQARGKPADRRADIWAFGCVLYEMLTGKQLFRGETVSDVLAAVIMKNPEWGDLPATVPGRIRQLLGRCLERDLRRRLQAIGEARITIEETMSGVDVAPPLSPLLTEEGKRETRGGERTAAMKTSPLQPWRRVLTWAAAAFLAGALAAGLGVWKFMPPSSPSTSMRFSTVTNFSGVQAQPALSPDGRSVAFVSNRDGNFNVYVGLTSGGSLVKLTNDTNLKDRPAWSPDGTKIAFGRLNESGIWDVWEIPAFGGTPRRLIQNATDPTWSPDGHSLAYTNMATGTVWIANDSGQNSRQLTPPEPPGWKDSEPRFSPDGRAIAFAGRSDGPYGELALVDLASGKVTRLTHDRALALSPAWSPDGRTIYFASSRGGTLNVWKIAARGGEPEQITSGQGDDAEIDVSSDGKRIVFSTFRQSISIAQLDLDAKPGQQNSKLLTTDLSRNQLAPAYSPDAKRVAYFSNLKGIEKEGIWLADADGSNPVQLIQDDRVNIFPRWTPDGSHLIYNSVASPLLPETWEARVVPASGGAPETIPVNSVGIGIDAGPEGQVLFGDVSHSQIRVFDSRNKTSDSFATLPAGQHWDRLLWSPDYRSIAYIVAPKQENDPAAGVWVVDRKSPPRRVFKGWVLFFARGPGNQIYLLESKSDLNAVLWRVGWDGGRLQRTPAVIRIPYYYNSNAKELIDYFDVSPDGKHLAFGSQEVLQANIGMIDGLR